MPNTPKMPRRAVFFDQLLKKRNALPGVESSGVVNPAPIEGWRGAMLVYIAVYDVKTLDELLAGFGLDWVALGLDDDAQRELVEHLLRTLQTLVLDPGSPPRSGDQVRAYLQRWLAPALRG